MKWFLICAILAICLGASLGQEDEAPSSGVEGIILTNLTIEDENLLLSMENEDLQLALHAAILRINSLMGVQPVEEEQEKPAGEQQEKPVGEQQEEPKENIGVGETSGLFNFPENETSEQGQQGALNARDDDNDWGDWGWDWDWDKRNVKRDDDHDWDHDDWWRWHGYRWWRFHHGWDWDGWDKRDNREHSEVKRDDDHNWDNHEWDDDWWRFHHHHFRPFFRHHRFHHFEHHDKRDDTDPNRGGNRGYRRAQCGNHRVEDGEQCDPPGECCDRNCQWKDARSSCNCYVGVPRSYRRGRPAFLSFPGTCSARSRICNCRGMYRSH